MGALLRKNRDLRSKIVTSDQKMGVPPAIGSPQNPHKPKFGALESGRFIAASLVVITHVFVDVNSHAAIPGNTIFGGYEAPGAIAVQYFFVLSGFVMINAHYNDFGKISSTPKFWWRRACRIYPLYWLALLIPVYYLHGFLTPRSSFQLFSLQPSTVQDFIPPAWSLRYEIAFYLMFGLCLLPYIGKPLLAAWVLAVCWVCCPAEIRDAINLPPPDTLNKIAARFAGHFLSIFEFYFFAGLAAGWAFIAVKPSNLWSLVSLTAGCVIIIMSLPFIEWGHSYGPAGQALTFALGTGKRFIVFKYLNGPAIFAPITGFAFGCMILGLAGLERHGTLRFGKFAGWLGKLSYPLYILHAPLMLIVSVELHWLKLGNAGLYWLLIVVLLSIYIICAMVTFLFDQPVQKQLRRIEL
jgi:peptidoglycan/LPS O-acetylase OafA/YrhL